MNNPKEELWGSEEEGKRKEVGGAGGGEGKEEEEEEAFWKTLMVQLRGCVSFRASHVAKSDIGQSRVRFRDEGRGCRGRSVGCREWDMGYRMVGVRCD